MLAGRSLKAEQATPYLRQVDGDGDGYDDDDDKYVQQILLNIIIIGYSN